MKANWKKYCVGSALVIFVFLLFSYITKMTPLAGDDWGYAMNGLKGNPIQTAFEFYFSWSGRFFSELWGFVVAPRKWLWNLLNPIFFSVISLFIFLLSDCKKKYVLTALALLAVILSVEDNLRMETYTWIMGTTYVIPLLLSFVYFWFVQWFINKVNITKKDKIFFVMVTNSLLFYIGLTMENIAATMIVATTIVAICSWFYFKCLKGCFISNVAVSALSFTIMRMSPGSAARLLGEHAAWSQMSLFEKLASGYSKFIEFTFLNNNYMILLLSMSLILLILYQFRKQNLILSVGSLVIQVIGVVVVFSFVLPFEHSLLNSKTFFNSIFWILYVVDVFAVLFFYVENFHSKWRMIFYLTVAGCANLVMMYSPIFGSRSSLYTVFYIALLICLILQEIPMSHWVSVVVMMMMIVIVGDRTSEYLYKYKLVNEIQMERLEIYNYYRDHPEDEEAWIPRMPPYTIHSADIEPDDTYHLQTFVEYYELPQSWDNVVFFWKDAY